MDKLKSMIILFIFIIGCLVFVPFSFASSTNGTIDSTYKYAWGENIGWINFDSANGNVQVTDSGLSGYALSENVGWINLTDVVNDGNGNLSGMAWGENVGWIKFNPVNGGVTINSSGEFSGSALSENVGWIIFDCSTSACVKTDWRPVSARVVVGTGGGGGNGGHPPITVPTSVLTTPIVAVVVPIINVVKNISNTVSSVTSSVSNLFSNLFKPKNQNVVTNIPVQIPKVAPLALNTGWNLLPVSAIDSFVFEPLPYQVRDLAMKFPELNKTFQSVGVERMTDMSKLMNATLNIPGLAEQINETIKNVGVQKLGDINNINGVALNLPGFSGVNENLPNSVGVGNIAMIPGLPLAKFTLTDKKDLPSEFVFARTAGELVDLNVALSFNQDGTVSQSIASLPGQMLKLVVKPISAARSVTGYFAFDSATPKISENTNAISRASLAASALFSTEGLVSQTPAPVPVEQKLVLSSFEYTDRDHDGIYTADVAAPGVPGSYEVVTVIDYVDPELGVRKMSMITVVDPEGYVYEKDGNMQTRIPGAIVSLYHLNTATKQYELWGAKEYQQENPQVTDVSGNYSFLVPPGSYYFNVQAPGYNPYDGKAFIVAEGGGIHQNIELTSGRAWFAKINWETVLLIVVLLLLTFNLFKDKLFIKNDQK